MKQMFKVLFCLSMVSLAIGCNESSSKSEGQSASVSTQMVTQTSSNSNEVVASTGGFEITQEKLDEVTKNQMMKVTAQIYSIQKRAIDDMIDNHLIEQEAAKQGITKQKLFSKIQSEAEKPTDEQVKMVYEMQKGRFGGKSFDEIKNQLKMQLMRQSQEVALNSLLKQLRKDADIKVNLVRPRADVSVDDDPSQGPSDAPITLIEFSEFQCPYCKRARPVLDQIMTQYAGKVRYVFRDFPLGFHGQAKGAANAANCANEQGKYWDYNKGLWSTQGQHTPEQLTKIAEDLHLNMSDFSKCVEEKRYYSEIDKDQRDGSLAGVSGTPAYFINGIFLSGAQPFEAFEEVIEDELQQKGL